MTEPPSFKKAFLPFLATTVALGALGTFLYRHRAHFLDYYHMHSLSLLLMAVLTIATLGLRGLSNKALFDSLGASASHADWFRLVTVNSFTNYLPFSAGLAVKAFLLKKMYRLPYRTFAMGQSALMLFIISTNGLVGLAALLFFFPSQSGGIIGAAFAMMSTAALLLFLPDTLRKFLGSRWPFPAGKSLPALRGRWPAVALPQAAALLCSAWMLKVAFDLGPSDTAYATCLIYAAVGLFSRLLSITPGALGVREFLMGGISFLMGFDVRDAVFASTVTRLVEIAVLFSLGTFFTYELSSRLVSRYNDDSNDGGGDVSPSTKDVD